MANSGNDQGQTAVAAIAPSPPEAPSKGVKLESHQVILRPLVTEKGTNRSTNFNSYAFEVNRMATKDDVKKAVEELFSVKVLRVHTLNRKGKPRKTRFRSGQTRDWKKAIVKLDPEHRIDFF